MTSLIAITAAEHAADLRRAAERRLAIPDNEGESQGQATVALRLAGADEADIVRELAELDDATALTGPVLLALVNGEAVAALSLSEHRVVANPFVRTEDAVALLRLRANHLWGGRRRRRSRAFLRPRFPRFA